MKGVSIMPKVVALIGNLNKEHGGAQQLLYDVYTNLASKDFDLTVFYMFGEGTFEEDFRENGVEVVNLEAKSNTDMRTLMELVKRLRQSGPDILHTNSPISGIWGRVGGQLAGVPHVVSVEHTVHNRYSRLSRYLNGVTLPLADTIIGVSPAVIESFQWWENLLIPSSVDICTIPNGIDVDKIESEIRARQVDATELGTQDVDTVIGTVGRLVEAKGYESLIQSLPSVLERYPGVKLVIVGDGPLKTELEELAKNLGVAEAITFTGYEANVFPYLHHFDVGVFPSVWEGFGLSLAEAVIAKCPVVASDIPAFRSIIGDAGIFTRPGDPLSVAKGILRLLDHPEEREEYQQKAYQRVSDQYSIERVAEEYATLYKNAADT